MYILFMWVNEPKHITLKESTTIHLNKRFKTISAAASRRAGRRRRRRRKTNLTSNKPSKPNYFALYYPQKQNNNKCKLIHTNECVYAWVYLCMGVGDAT